MKYSGKEKMEEKIKKNEIRIAELVCFFIALIPRLWIALQAIPVRTIGDELGHIAGAAYFAGQNWESSIVNTQYYGQGFYSLFFWVFLLTDNPIIIYRTILSICCVFQASVIFVIFYICRNYAKINNIRNISLIALSSSYLIVTRVDIIYNESILNVLVWIICLVLCKIVFSDTNKGFVIWSILLCMLVGWGITIHLRFAVFVIALFLAFIIYYVVIKREYKFIYVLAALSVFCLLGYLWVKQIQKLIWRPDGNVNSLGNTTVNLKSTIDFFDITGIVSKVSIVLGQIGTITIFSCSFFSVALICLIIFVWKNRGKHEDKFYTIILICGGSLLLAILGTSFAQALSWGDGVYKGVFNNITDSSFYSYKAFTYVRYFGPYISPFIAMGSMILWRENDIQLKKVLKVNVVVVLSLVIYWLNYIQKYIANNLAASEVFLFYSQTGGGKVAVESVYLFGVFWVLLSTLIILFFSKKYMNIAYILLIFVLIWNYIYTAQKFDLYTQKNNYKKIDKTYEFIQKKGSFPQDIYYYYFAPENLSHKTYATNYLLLQFWLPQKQIIPLETEFELKEDAIVITNNVKFTKLVEVENYLFVQLDDNEYLFVFGDYVEEYKKYLKECSIKYKIHICN